MQLNNVIIFNSGTLDTKRNIVRLANNTHKKINCFICFLFNMLKN